MQPQYKAGRDFLGIVLEMNNRMNETIRTRTRVMQSLGTLRTTAVVGGVLGAVSAIASLYWHPIGAWTGLVEFGDPQMWRIFSLEVGFEIATSYVIMSFSTLLLHGTIIGVLSGALTAGLFVIFPRPGLRIMLLPVLAVLLAVGAAAIMASLAAGLAASGETSHFYNVLRSFNAVFRPFNAFLVASISSIYSGLWIEYRAAASGGENSPDHAASHATEQISSPQ